MATRKRKNNLRFSDKLRLIFIVFLAGLVGLTFVVGSMRLTFRKSAAERTANIGFAVWVHCLKRVDQSERGNEYLAYVQECLEKGGEVRPVPVTPSVSPTASVTVSPTPTPEMPPKTPTPTSTDTYTVELEAPFAVGTGGKLPSVAVTAEGKAYYTGWVTDSRRLWLRICRITNPSCEGEIQIDTGGKESFYSNIAVDGEGKAYLVWESDVGGTERYAVYFSSYDGEWSTPQKISQEPYSEVPHIAVGIDRKLHVVYQSKTAAGGSIYYRSSSDDGNTWSAAKKLGDGFWPRVTADGAYQAHVVWNGNSPGYGIFYRRQTGSGQWGSTQTVSSGHKEQTADIRAGGSGVIHITWGNYDTLKVGYTRYVDGQKETLQSNLSGDLTASLWPKLALDPSGRAYIAFQGKSDRPQWETYLVYQTTNATTWSTPTLLKKGTGSVQSPQIDLNGVDGAITYTDGTTAYGQSFSLK